MQISVNALQELANRWTDSAAKVDAAAEDVGKPNYEDGISDGMKRGLDSAKVQCAEELNLLIKLLAA